MDRNQSQTNPAKAKGRKGAPAKGLRDSIQDVRVVRSATERAEQGKRSGDGLPRAGRRIWVHNPGTHGKEPIGD